MPKVKAIFYDLPDGSYPAQEFIDSLDIKIPYSEYLRGGILELRAKVGSNNDFPISCTIESA